MKTLRAAVVLLLGVVVTGCGGSRVVREPDAARRTGPVSPVVRHGATTVVQRGDTLYGIAFRNGVDFRQLAAWNGIGPPYTIYPGQRLRLYPGGASTPERSRSARATLPRTSAPRRVVAPASAPPAAPISDLDWQWPARGEVISRYVAGEPTRQGIDIAGEAGAPVRAAADGTVVYSGAGLVGYGELVIVKHSDTWLSAYGHNRARQVNEGQRVRKGEQIAEMGRSGAARDMLHFEIRYNGKPVDPLRYLPRR